MSQNDQWYLENQPKPSLRAWIFNQMALGATYAALALFGIIAVILVIYAISFLLPEDPFAVLDTGQRVLGAFA